MASAIGRDCRCHFRNKIGDNEHAREEYDRINTKTLASFPEAVFLDTAMPLGQLYIYPWPSPAAGSRTVAPCTGRWGRPPTPARVW